MPFLPPCCGTSSSFRNVLFGISTAFQRRTPPRPCVLRSRCSRIHTSHRQVAATRGGVNRHGGTFAFSRLCAGGRRAPNFGGAAIEPGHSWANVPPRSTTRNPQSARGVPCPPQGRVGPPAPHPGTSPFVPPRIVVVRGVPGSFGGQTILRLGSRSWNRASDLRQHRRDDRI